MASIFELLDFAPAGDYTTGTSGNELPDELLTGWRNGGWTLRLSL
jgi:hypothetical protein